MWQAAPALDRSLGSPLQLPSRGVLNGDAAHRWVTPWRVDGLVDEQLSAE
jgi:hypothetical protein